MITGCIHGRFQPFHNGHLEYMTAAGERCDRLIIGITQYDSDLVDSESPRHRMNAFDNPFTYWERAQIIMAAVAGSGMHSEKASIVPFPIHKPSNIRNFVDPNSIMFTTIYERWNIDKVRRLKSCGFEVCVLWRRRYKKYEGRAVREALREDPPSVKNLVPTGVYEKILAIRPDLVRQ